MESKLARKRRIAKRIRALTVENGATAPTRHKPVSSLIASAKLSNRSLRQIIRCYADGRTPKEASETCRVSQVTIRRMYRQIRERLIAVCLYEDRISPGAPASYLEQERKRHTALMRKRISPHRGVKDANLASYFAEAIYRRDTTFGPGQLYGLILNAIADLGPLNRKARLVWPENYFFEYKRILIGQARARIRSCASLSEDDETYLPEDRALFIGITELAEAWRI